MINPDTPVAAIGQALERASLVLVMSVNPGFGAQAFMDVALPKLAELRALREKHGYGYLLETFVPMLRAVGVTQAQIDTLLVTNPATVLAIR